MATDAIQRGWHFRVTSRSLVVSRVSAEDKHRHQQSWYLSAKRISEDARCVYESESSVSVFGGYRLLESAISRVLPIGSASSNESHRCAVISRSAPKQHLSFRAVSIGRERDTSSPPDRIREFASAGCDKPLINVLINESTQHTAPRIIITWDCYMTVTWKLSFWDYARLSRRDCRLSRVINRSIIDRFHSSNPPQLHRIFAVT